MSRRCLVLVVATVLSPAPIVAGEPTCAVAYDADRLTVHAERAPLVDVIREIGKQTGAEIVGEVRKPRDVTRDFEAVPLVDALARLVGEQNFALRYGSDGKLRKIELLGEPQAVASAAPPAADATRPERPSAHRHRNHAQPAHEQLSDGQPHATVAEVGATNQSEAMTSSQASGGSGALSPEGAIQQEQWPAPDELDRKLRRSFLSLLAQMDGATLAQYFTTPEGQRARAFLEDFATSHPDGSSKQKATDILGRVPGQATTAP